MKKEERFAKVWENFKNDIIYKNRYFVGSEVLSVLNKFNTINLVGEGTKLEFYRARIGNYIIGDDSLLLAPPQGKSSAGRCNPEGISYLYLANNLETAINEIRPNIHDTVSAIKLNVDISNIFSFRAYFQNLPLSTGLNAEELSLIRLIDNDLASKVTFENKLNYIPLQFVSEYVKKRGFDGFLYSSTVGLGMNLVMFNWHNKIEVLEKKIVNINNVNYNFDELNKTI